MKFFYGQRVQKGVKYTGIYCLNKKIVQYLNGVYKCTKIFKYGWTIMNDAEHFGLLSLSTVILHDRKATVGQYIMGMCTEKEGDCVGK